MNPYDELIKNIPQIEAKIGYTFTNRDHLLNAFVHSSFLNEYRVLSIEDNERLEFLGDSVLNLIVAEYLFRNFPDLPEGELSSKRGHIVSAASCVQFVEHLQIDQYVLVGKGQKLNKERKQVTILADLFEALLGAIYLDGGLEGARAFFFNYESELLQNMLNMPKSNFKALLQEYAQKTKRGVPQYRVVDAKGPEHEKKFEIAVYIADVCVGIGSGTSKKQAEQRAAQNALQNVQEASS